MYVFLPTSLYLFLPRYVSIHPSTYLSISPKYVHGPVVPAKNSKSIIFKKWILNDLSMTRVRRKISLFFHCAAAQLKSLLSSSCEYYLFLPHKSANYQIWRSSEPKKSFRVWLKSGPNFMQWMDVCLSTKLTWIEVELKPEVRSSNPANGKLFHCQLYWNDKNTDECGNSPNF